MQKITLALDAMSGDQGHNIVVLAAIEILNKYENITLILVGDQAILNSALTQVDDVLCQRLQIHHAAEVVNMDDLPAQALRSKKDSSMRLAIELVKDGKAQAVVSAGNTGALMAISRFLLKTVTNVDRPAIMAHIPSYNPCGFVRILDLGGNVDSTAEQLLQFAVMGSVVASAVNHIERPRVALLNIGEEEIKGNEQVKRAAELLANNKTLNYIGFIEGNDLFKGDVDVIVCDGFVGNITLKVMEGTAKVIFDVLKKKFMKNTTTKFIALLSKPILKSVLKEFDPAKHNGASFLGLKGIVVKSHGNASVKGFTSAIEHAIWEIENNIIDLIEKQTALLLEQYQ